MDDHCRGRHLPSSDQRKLGATGVRVNGTDDIRLFLADVQCALRPRRSFGSAAPARTGSPDAVADVSPGMATMNLGRMADSHSQGGAAQKTVRESRSLKACSSATPK